MELINSKNIYIKRQYRQWLLNARQLSEDTVDKMERAIDLYEEYTGYKDFKYFNIETIVEFKKSLKNRRYKNKLIAPNSYRTYMIHLKKFFEWLSDKPGYKSRISSDMLEYLRISRKENSLANQITLRKFPSQEYIVRLTEAIKPVNDVERRNRALISFTYLTGMRDSAIISLPLQVIDIDGLYIAQDPKLGVRTKFSKTIYSKIFRFNDNLLEYFVSWYKYLSKKGLSNVDPVFPRSKCIKQENSLSFDESSEIEPVFWASTSSIRTIFKKYTKNLGIEYYPPHTFRHAAIFNALKLAKNGDEVKAISQNFGHEDVTTTLSVYAQYEPETLLEVLSNLDYKGQVKITNEDIFQIIKDIQKSIR